MGKKTKTMDLKGNDYARVRDRVKEFRQDNPNGVIETKTEFAEGNVIVHAFVCKDGSQREIASGTGQAFGKLPEKPSDKFFEKLETVAVGRALAFLGYLSTGEIASSEEMEEFFEFRNEKKDALIKAISEAKTIEELKEVFVASGSLMADPEVLKAKNVRKEELSASAQKNEIQN